LDKGGGLDYRTVNKLCALLNCQPGDLMEYVPDAVPDGNAEENA
jgi:putative transcriptional regulator